MSLGEALPRDRLEELQCRNLTLHTPVEEDMAPHLRVSAVDVHIDRILHCA